MANVDPFVIRWPKKWESDPELRDVLRYLNRFLHDLWIRTGGGPDLIEEGLEAIEDLQDQINVINDRLDAIDIRLDLIEADIVALYALVAALDVRVTDLEARVTYLEGSTATTAEDFTTTGETAELTVICTNTVPITITMNLTPADKEKVNIVTQGTGTVTISGPVNGKTTTSIIGSYSSPHLIYTDAAGEWNFT